MSQAAQSAAAAKAKSGGPAERARGALLANSHLILLLVLCLMLTELSPAFLTTGNVLNVFRQASLLLILALAQMLVMLTAGIDLSNGAIVALSSCVAGVVLRDYGLVPGVVTGLAIGGLCGAANGLMVTRIGLPSFIAPFGAMWAYRGLAFLFLGGEVVFGFSPAFRFIGAGQVLGIPAPILIAAAVALAFYFLLSRTAFGRAVYGVGANSRAAFFAGIRVERTLFRTYTLAGVVAAGVGLILIARLDAAEPLIGESFPLDSIAAAVIGGTSFDGGVGTVRGTLMGALIMTVILNGLNLLGVSSYWQGFVTGAVVVITLLVNTWIGHRQ